MYYGSNDLFFLSGDHYRSFGGQLALRRRADMPIVSQHWPYRQYFLRYWATSAVTLPLPHSGPRVLGVHGGYTNTEKPDSMAGVWFSRPLS